MKDDLIAEFIWELRNMVRAFITEYQRALNDPDCECDNAARLALAVAALESIAHESVDDEGIYTARRALEELKGEKE